jgi:hypothetical protein
MLQIPTSSDELICRMTNTGFEICGISQELPYLKHFCDENERNLADFSINKDSFKIDGFRAERLRQSQYRPFLFEGKQIPREFQPFFYVVELELENLLFRIEKFHTQTPIDDEISIITKEASNDPIFKSLSVLQARYIGTALRLVAKIPPIIDLWIDALCVLAEFFVLESLLVGLIYDWTKFPLSGFCPQCLEPMADPKDQRYSGICKKCRNKIKIERQRERRGTKIIGERYCACGCGEIITGNPKKKYLNDTHGRRMQKRYNY